jgi:hypothetical protein
MSNGRSIVPRTRWPYISLIPIGLGAWAPIYAGVKARAPLWIVLGLLWCACVVAGFVVDASSSHSGSDDFAGFLFIAGWVGAVATSFSIRSAYDRRMASPLEAAEEVSQQRLADRHRALVLAQSNPALAADMGIGRPDVPGAADAGLVDLNNASLRALMKLPRVNDALATEIVEARARINGFQSLEDMGTALDLDGDVVEALRDRVVFLPRTHS